MLLPGFLFTSKKSICFFFAQKDQSGSANCGMKEDEMCHTNVNGAAPASCSLAAFYSVLSIIGVE